MGCQDCWAFSRDKSLHFFCRISYDTIDRPDELSPDVKRTNLSPVFDYELLKKWPCEYRYTRNEIEFIQAGKGKDVKVSKAEIARLRSLLPEH